MGPDNVQTAGDHSPDVVIVGAGIAGIYGIKRLRETGMSVLGIEAAPEVGGVWYHNGYPGARVDLDSDMFNYFFDEELYKTWDWEDRYATQPQVLAYLKHVADKYDVRRSIRFNTRVIGTTWQPKEKRWLVETDDGATLSPRYLVMATGQLSRPRDPQFEGLHDFEGEWYQTSRWPHDEVELAGKRIAVIGTGSSGVQAATAIAEVADHLTVFQRTPHYSIPAQNRRPDESRRQRLRGRFPELWNELSQTHFGGFAPPPAGPASAFSTEDQQLLLQQRWDFGSQSMVGVFSDQAVDWDTNTLVAEFVRSKVRDKVEDPAIRAAVVPDEYPIGTKRLILDTGYYEALNQDNVNLVDMRSEPIVRLTPHGIQTTGREYEFDVIVFAMGFEAFTGALDDANIRNADGVTPSQAWDRGPQTYLGLQTRGFPNLFFLTGAGSPSVLANMFVANQHHVDVLAELFTHMNEHGFSVVQPQQRDQDAWVAHSAEVAEKLIRREINQYMVKVTDDGTRVFIPYAGGFKAYYAKVKDEIDTGWPGFEFA
ncbi:NAD(P)/FAD-dependent oxidoreductase [Arthrobacter sp. D1-29]